MNNAWKKFGGSRVSDLLRRSRHTFHMTTAPVNNSTTTHSDRPKTGSALSGEHRRDPVQIPVAAAAVTKSDDVRGETEFSSARQPLLARLRQSTLKNHFESTQNGRQSSSDSSDDEDSIQEMPYIPSACAMRRPAPRNTKMDDILPIRLPCKECVRTYANSKTLAQHVRLAHAEGKKKMVCDFCGRDFVRKTFFDNHVERCRNDAIGIRSPAVPRQQPVTTTRRVVARKTVAPFSRYPPRRPDVSQVQNVAIPVKTPAPAVRTGIKRTDPFETSDSDDSEDFPLGDATKQPDLVIPKKESLDYLPMSPSSQQNPITTARAPAQNGPPTSFGPRLTYVFQSADRMSVGKAIEPAGVYKKLFDCYFCGDEITPKEPPGRPSLSDTMDHYKQSGECFWKALRTAELGKDMRDKVIKVEQNDAVDAGLILEYRRCMICQKSFANEVPALIRHATCHPAIRSKMAKT